MKFISSGAVRFFCFTEVSTFANCPTFFFSGNPPTIFPNNNRYKQICQCLPNQPGFYYATLYDTTNRIPVYSAYLFRHGNTDRQTTWYIEPQVLILKPHAKNADYENSDYHKGHLYPVRHTATQEQMKATFTLTNAAPQESWFNQGSWSQHEANLRNILQACPQAFVVTGVVPGAQTINNRVRVAAYYWSAYCCDNNGQLTSGGFIGPDQNRKVEDMPVQNLECIKMFDCKRYCKHIPANPC
uniref:Uncharacterized protein n=1 Tax=Myripristis murdjan TaxID=586833 RepID=A0A667ZM48_9TELE